MTKFKNSFKQIIYIILMQKFIEIYGEETHCTEQFIDILVEKGNVFKRYYSKLNYLTRNEINNLISKIMINDNFILDKVSSQKMELVDSKTGKIRYIIWNNNCVEKYFMKDLGPIKPENYLLE